MAFRLRNRRASTRVNISGPVEGIIVGSKVRLAIAGFALPAPPVAHAAFLSSGARGAGRPRRGRSGIERLSPEHGPGPASSLCRRRAIRQESTRPPRPNAIPVGVAELQQARPATCRRKSSRVGKGAYVGASHSRRNSSGPTRFVTRTDRSAMDAPASAMLLTWCTRTTTATSSTRLRIC